MARLLQQSRFFSRKSLFDGRRTALEARTWCHLDAQGDTFEWAELLRDLEALQFTEVESHGKRFLLRSDLANTTAAVFRAAGVGIPPRMRKTAE